ncbi:hypothetical protein PCL_08857 [Purpureocillium lilacinum]|uniref:Uncharacterized protein n=1 Tax=Purpureocillium lilacinum TaxID=33203 RepID=A0A2U3EGE9_PURLI|nr:hypothetical protein PCL_08857 [Purpureocillium lilacinum]
MQCAAAAGWWPLHDPHARTSAVLTSIDEFGWHSPLLTPGTHAAASPVTKAPGLEHETPAPGPMGRPRASGRNPTHGRSPKVVPILWLPECRPAPARPDHMARRAGPQLRVYLNLAQASGLFLQRDCASIAGDTTEKYGYTWCWCTFLQDHDCCRRARAWTTCDGAISPSSADLQKLGSAAALDALDAHTTPPPAHWLLGSQACPPLDRR